MSKEIKEKPQINPSEQELMKISDYSEGKNSEIEEYPFEELQNILSPEESRQHKEQFYKQKMVELQQKCGKLFKTASYLTKRIEDLQLELNDQTQSELNPAVVHEFLEELSIQIDKYKKDLGIYQEKQLEKCHKQNQELQHLRAKVQDLKTENEELQNKVFQTEDKNKELQQTKADLLNELQTLENQLEDIKLSKKKPQKTYARSKFDDEIQAELEVLIQKLMGQLQTERNNTKKAVLEMKRMQEELMNLERQLATKNNKIYTLEMKQLRSNRQANKKGASSDRFTFQKNEISLRNKNRNERNPATRNITFQEYLEDSPEVNQKERYIVALKIINLFIRKMEEEDLVSLLEDQILLSNYSKENPYQIAIREVPNIQPSTEQTSAKILAWNLSMLLSKLLIQPSYDSDYFDDSVKVLTQALNQLIDDQNPSISSFTTLKNLLDQILKAAK